MKPVVQIPASSYAEDDGIQSITLEVLSQISKHDPWQFTLFIDHWSWQYNWISVMKHELTTTHIRPRHISDQGLATCCMFQEHIRGRGGKE